METQAISDERLFPYFQDILEPVPQNELRPNDNDGAFLDEDESENDDDDDEDELNSKKLDSQNLTLDEIVAELQKRGLQARGFFVDDAKLLQQQFDKEDDEYQENKRQERLANKERNEREQLEKKRRKRIEFELNNEREHLDKNERMAALLLLIKRGCSPTNLQVELNSSTARSLAFALCSSTSNIVYLDVSNQGLPDYAGAYLCRALGKNTTLKKLELGSNNFGSQTCKALGNSLFSNTTVEYVCLECNPLVNDISGAGTCSSSGGGGGDSDSLSGIRVLADMLAKNKSLRHLSLWKCMIGAEGGKMIANALESSNDILTMLKCGYNSWEDSTLRRIDAKARANREVRRIQREAEATQREEEERRRLEQKKIEEDKAREEASQRWFEQQKKDRADARRKEAEQRERERQEREQAEEEERKRVEEDAAKLAAKKKKPRKKGKKK